MFLREDLRDILEEFYLFLWRKFVFGGMQINIFNEFLVLSKGWERIRQILSVPGVELFSWMRQFEKLFYNILFC